MSSRVIGATLAVVAGAVVLAGPAVGPAVAAPTGVVRMDPPHDQHCTRNGFWHKGSSDTIGHRDARCPRW